MTTEIATTLATIPKHPTAEQAQHITASWQALQHTRIETQEERDLIEAIADAVSQPATASWIAGRVATMLVQYYTAPLPQEMTERIADDWNRALSKYPAWAISEACHWWMGEKNEKRRQKPMPGDIAARCGVEMVNVTRGRMAVWNWDREEPQRLEAKRRAEAPKISKEERAESDRILKETMDRLKAKCVANGEMRAGREAG